MELNATAVSPWEIAAVLLALAYLVLAIRENVLCWPAAILSSALYLGIFAGAGLYMVAGLQVFYLAVAVYGWRAWQPGAGGESLRVHTWPLSRHLALIAGIGALALGSGWLLATFTAAQLPYLDALTTWGAIAATAMVARKLLENWYYWFVIDGLSLGIYFNRELYLTAALFALYLVLVIVGWRTWRRSMAACR